MTRREILMDRTAGTNLRAFSQISALNHRDRNALRCKGVPGTARAWLQSRRRTWLANSDTDVTTFT